MIDMCEAYWLDNHIASYQIEPKIRNEEVQVWQLEIAIGLGQIFWYYIYHCNINTT